MARYLGGKRGNKPRKIKIMDWLVHGGHQYEFFKNDYNFVCTGLNGGTPKPHDLGRPKNDNVQYTSETRASSRNYFDIIMIRAGIDPARYVKFRYKKGAPAGIVVMQTFKPFKFPKWVRCAVWNSKVVMEKYMDSMPNQKHFYIPHGFDPKEFDFLNLKRNNRVLSAASLFKQRGRVLGYEEWAWITRRFGRCDLLGHGNTRIRGSIGSFPLERLVKTYNKYGVFLNTTTKSAMPRVRAEALMCGTPLITTNNFGIDRYLTHEKNCLFADTKEDMLSSIKRLLASKDMREDLSLAGREVAMKKFHIKKYLSRWDEVFVEACR